MMIFSVKGTMMVRGYCTCSFCLGHEGLSHVDIANINANDPECAVDIAEVLTSQAMDSELARIGFEARASQWVDGPVVTVVSDGDDNNSTGVQA